ncbi:cell division protein FtsW [Candidatus Nomurabacteria bacterium RIFCSPLOWO2_12_FULL_46_14]|uniref:Probable peptidoglycan glycosyltransferase FtsW n=1 Tax=Candidatus Nomurabacteria bacterium RIFCSPLOWO2_12_FULL_46_14 TaxID=1801797 RepID=A0A1F6YC26_9BACT|nr:MAG: cell division protein FtsW [Candidatus Nomurabacteria bacterium RIFCSPLOWO2_12_FULL_46_14]
MKSKKINKIFLFTIFLMVIVGLAMFVSASLGILAKSADTFRAVLKSQLVLGLGLGLVGMYAALKINYKFWRKYSFFIFIIALLVTAAVFIPGVGSNRGTGALRWITLGSFSFQPVEILKFGFVIFFAAWLSWVKNRVQNFRFGLLPLVAMLSVIALLLLNQPDTKSFILIAVTGLSMLFISGVPFKYIFTFGLLTVFSLGVFAAFTPYLQDRIKTFLDPSSDPQGASYQIQQSLIALGSGEILGRGYGQSIQKFSYLPEPQGDSIFAVVGEEFGFVGAVALILLYLFFALLGFRIANRAPDLFSRLLVSGIVILITAQSFMHIASVVGVLPLTGVPLPFMSHGGTSYMIDLAAIGIVLQISKFSA